MSNGMKFLKFVFPFLFKRNWYDGSWELSRTRVIVFLSVVGLVLLGIAAAYWLQAPVIYSTEA